MNFSGSNTKGLGESKQTLRGNNIYTVKFDGVEKVEMKNGEMHCLRIKFSNDEGYFNHTIFEPQPGDDQETQGAFGPNPSRIAEMMTLLRHLGAAVCPELNKKIDAFDDKTTWEQIRNIVVETTTPAIGTETKIKLMKRKYNDPNTGAPMEEAQFPRFFLAYNREGALYMKTSFIGKGVYFSSKELSAIKKQEEAKPVSVNNFDLTSNTSGSFDAAAPVPNDDFNMDI